MGELSIKELAAVLRRGIALLILVPLVITSAVGAYLYLFAKDKYTAEVELYVLIDYGAAMGSMRYDVNTSTSFAGDYQKLMMTHEVISAAAKKLGMENLDPLRIDVSSEGNTRIIDLSVTGVDPSLCAKAANAISEVFIDYLSTITQTKSISIASQAMVPTAPTGLGRIYIIAIALAASILFAAGMLIVIEKMNTTLRTSEDIAEFLHLQVLARVSGYKGGIRKFLAQKEAHKPLYSLVSSDTREGIKTLSMNLQFISARKNIKTIAITSAIPNEGKSSTAIMLATSLAEKGKRVLLCDMDFMNPSLGKYLGVRSMLDIVDVLKGTAKTEMIISESNVNRLYLVDSYHKHILLSNVAQSPQFLDFLAAVRQRFDYVILDTPPMGMFIDSAMLASIADGTLLVVASGRVERALGLEIVEQLQNANATVVGVALNFVKERSNRSGRNSRHYNYDQEEICLVQMRGARPGYGDRGPYTARMPRSSA